MNITNFGRHMKYCLKCGSSFKNRENIDGKERNLSKRKYCLTCSPFNAHNTKNLIENKDENKDKTKRRCCSCKEFKPLYDFYKYKNRFQYTCKVCNLQNLRDRQKKSKSDAVNYLGGICNSCGYKGPDCTFDFHHKSPDNKKFKISSKHLAPLHKIKDELDKCELLCAICHRLKHSDSI